MVSRISFIGSRSLEGKFAKDLVKSVVMEAVNRRQTVFGVGCAAGADAMSLGWLVGLGAAKRVRVFSIGSEKGSGYWKMSSYQGVRYAKISGSRVSWWAGGNGDLKTRLRRRSESMVNWTAEGDSSSGIIAFLSPIGVEELVTSGSWRTIRYAVSKGLPVLVYTYGFAGSQLPRLSGLGQWISLPGGGWLWYIPTAPTVTKSPTTKGVRWPTSSPVAELARTGNRLSTREPAVQVSCEAEAMGRSSASALNHWSQYRDPAQYITRAIVENQMQGADEEFEKVRQSWHNEDTRDQPGYANAVPDDDTEDPSWERQAWRLEAKWVSGGLYVTSPMSDHLEAIAYRAMVFARNYRKAA